MAKKGGGSQPKAPDPAATSAAQTASNVDTAIANAWLNSGNMSTPWGSTTTQQIGSQNVGGRDVPIFSQNLTLSPQQQQIYEQGVQGDLSLNQLGLDQIGRISQSVQQPFSLEAIGQQPVYDDAYRNRQEQALMDRLQPYLDRDRQSLEARLASRGLTTGSEAYGQGFDQFNRQANDARLAVIAQGGNEAARQYGIDTSSYQQRLANALLERERPLQEFAQFMGTSNNFVSPQPVGGVNSQIAPTDVMGPIYQAYGADMNAYNQGQSAQNSLYGALAGLAGSALGGWSTTW